MWFGGWTLRELAIDGTRQNGVGPKPDCDVDGRPNRGTLLVEVAEPELADHIRGMEGIADFLSA